MPEILSYTGTLNIIETDRSITIDQTKYYYINISCEPSCYGKIAILYDLTGTFSLHESYSFRNQILKWHTKSQNCIETHDIPF